MLSMKLVNEAPGVTYDRREKAEQVDSTEDRGAGATWRAGHVALAHHARARVAADAEATTDLQRALPVDTMQRPSVFGRSKAMSGRHRLLRHLPSLHALPWNPNRCLSDSLPWCPTPCPASPPVPCFLLLCTLFSPSVCCSFCRVMCPALLVSLAFYSPL